MNGYCRKSSEQVTRYELLYYFDNYVNIQILSLHCKNTYGENVL
jgi:hypothetical protein